MFINLCKSRPTWGVWIEIRSSTISAAADGSRPTWGVWIEIICCQKFSRYIDVAPHLGRVD